MLLVFFFFLMHVILQKVWEPPLVEYIFLNHNQLRNLLYAIESRLETKYKGWTSTFFEICTVFKKLQNL